MDKKRMSNKVYKTSPVDKKKVKKTKQHNQIKDIVDSDTVDEVVAQIASTSGDKKDQRRDKFLLYWLLGYPVRVAGLTAGYKESYAKFGLYEVLKLPIVKERLLKITSAMPEKYRALCRMRLGDVAEIEGKALKEMKDNPEKALKHPQLLKQVKQSAGVLADDGVIQPIQINIKEIQLFNQARLDERIKQIQGPAGDVIDVQAEEDNKT